MNEKERKTITKNQLRIFCELREMHIDLWFFGGLLVAAAAKGPILLWAGLAITTTAAFLGIAWRIKTKDYLE